LKALRRAGSGTGLVEALVLGVDFDDGVVAMLAPFARACGFRKVIFRVKSSAFLFALCACASGHRVCVLCIQSDLRVQCDVKFCEIKGRASRVSLVNESKG